MSSLTDVFREPTERLSRLILEILMNGSYPQPMAKVPLSNWGIQEDSFSASNTQSFSVPLIISFQFSLDNLSYAQEFYLPGCYLQ